MVDSNLGPEKSFVFDFVDRNAEAVATIGDSVFYFGELGMQEHESAKLMTSILEKEGFSVERGISGFPTGFCATFGSGDPVIAMHTEYDANPNNKIPEELIDESENISMFNIEEFEFNTMPGPFLDNLDNTEKLLDNCSDDVVFR